MEVVVVTRDEDSASRCNQGILMEVQVVFPVLEPWALPLVDWEGLSSAIEPCEGVCEGVCEIVQGLKIARKAVFVAASGRGLRVEELL